MTRNTGNSRGTPERSAEESQLTRRAALASAAGTTFGLAGCLELGESGARSSPTGSASFLEGISFDGQDMVVQLSDDHSIDRLNLIGPDGSEFASTSVATGETKARLRILEITPGDYLHYRPGTSELHAVSGENVDSAEITLQPSIEIKNMEQYSGSKHRDYGNVEISIKIRGLRLHGFTTYIFQMRRMRKLRRKEMGSRPRLDKPRRI